MARLHRAARIGKKEDVTAYLAQGDDIDAIGILHKTPLMIAAEEGHLAIVELLLQAGADVRIATRKGGTALHRGAHGGHLKVVQALVAHGADVNALSGGMTPAMAAAQFDRQEVAHFLLDQGTDATVRDREGLTAADWLAMGGIQGKFKRLFPHDLNASLNAIAHATKSVRRMMEEGLSAEEYAAKHGRYILVWGYGNDHFEDEEAGQWAKRVAEILFTPSLLEVFEEQYLEGETLEEARKRRAKRIKNTARRARQDARKEA